MPRKTDEWVGKTDDTPAPPRVRARVFAREGGRCYLSGRLISPADAWDLDHKIAVINGGENRESNLFPALRDRHKEKTKDDIAEKAKVSRTRQKHLGIKKPKRQWTPDPKKWRKIGFGQFERRKDT